MINKGISYIGVFFLRVLSYLPFPVLYGMASLLYFPLYYVIGYRKKTVRKNLIHSFPGKSLSEIKNIERKFYRYLADIIFENVKLYSISAKALSRRVHFVGLEEMDKFHEKGQKVMMCTGHYGNWEFMGLGLSLINSAKTISIYKPLNNKIFERWFNKMRTRFGAIFVPMRQTLRALQMYKDDPITLCFASDQSPAKDDARHFIDFLHQPTPVLLGIEKISKRTNSPIFYFKTSRVKRGYYQVECILICAEPAETAEFEITQMHFKVLEEIINAQPEFWLWSHNRWKHKPQTTA